MTDKNPAAQAEQTPTQDGETPAVSLPRYKSHKIVQAFKIDDISESSEGGAMLDGVDDSRYVNKAYLEKHNPQIGGYYVLYPDGYESWSPAEAFEAGYHRYDDPINLEEGQEAREARLAQEAAERAEFPTQKVRIRAEPGSKCLGLVVQRFEGGVECDEMQPRTTYERELGYHDELHVIALTGRSREAFMRAAGIEPVQPLSPADAAQQDGE